MNIACNNAHLFGAFLIPKSTAWIEIMTHFPLMEGLELSLEVKKETEILLNINCTCFPKEITTWGVLIDKSSAIRWTGDKSL